MSLYGITGIGNGLGTFGLGGTSTYGSYTDPSMMGMYGGYSPYTSGAYSPYSIGAMGGMMGMYNPTFMAQMTQMQQDMEKSQLKHSGTIHQLMLQNETKAFTDQDRAIFEKAMVDSAVNEGITNLAEMVRKGDTDGICTEFDKLKQTLYSKYGDYFNSKGDSIDPNKSVTNYIELLYSKIVSTNLRDDIRAYGENAFEHGFWKSWKGSDYHSKNAEEAISYIFGTPIDNKSGQDRISSIGGATEKIVEGGAALAVGYGAGIGLSAICKVLNPLNTCKNLGLKGAHRFGKFGALAALVGDIMWQMNK